MNIPHTLLPRLALCAMPLLQPAQACISETMHPHLLLDGMTASIRTALTPPQEVQLTAGTLLSVLLPPGLSAHSDSPLLLALDNARYRELSAMGGGQMPPQTADDSRITLSGRPMSWAHFGAAASGSSWLRLSSKGKPDGWVHLQIDPAPVVARGVEIRLSEADDNHDTTLSYYDRLVVELPGSPGDGWTVTEAPGLRLLAIEALPSPQPRVRLRFESSSDQGKGTLQLRSSSNRYRFGIVHQPTPLC